MAKETYYFSHDHNARNDRKIAALVKDYKSSGYGIYWATCEMMHEEGGAIEFDELTFGSIAKDLNEDSGLIGEVLEKCVEKYKLFSKQIEAVLQANEASRSSTVLLRSRRIDRNLSDRKDAKQNKKKAGQLGGIKSGESRRNKKKLEAERSSASSNEAKERKGKERIEIQNSIQLCPEMVKIFKTTYPKYPSDQENDFPACLQIAYKIADSKEWTHESAVNGKMGEVLKIWQFMVNFSATDDWFKTRAISDFNKEYQRLVQKITNTKVERKEEKPQPTGPPLKKIN
jgi:hypothetical protein